MTLFRRLSETVNGTEVTTEDLGIDFMTAVCGAVAKTDPRIRLDAAINPRTKINSTADEYATSKHASIRQ